MAARGVDALTDRELLSLLTEDEQSAEALLAAYGGSLARVGSEEAARLRMIGGLGLRRARMLLATLSHEECWAVYLTSSNRIIERQRVSQGGVQGTVVDHRLIIKRALELLATQLILIHNHPSGAAEASPQDKVLTERIAQAAALFDIRLLDHIIIAREGDFSFLREGLIS